MPKKGVGRALEKGTNQHEYEKRVIESGQVPNKGSNLGKYQRRVQAITERVIESGKVPEEFG